MAQSTIHTQQFSHVRRLIALLAMALAAFAVHGQELAVESFTLLPNDMTARTLQPVRDANGDLTALIKVVTTEQGFDFDGGSLGIVKVVQQPGEIWVYVPDRARSVTIRHGKLGVLRNYAYPVPVQSGNVYEMKLSHGTVEVVVKPREIVTEWFVVSSTPAGADVYVDDQAVGKTPFSAELPEGKYAWRVERNLYQPEAGIAELKAGNRVALDLALKPNFGRIELSSTPDAGAKVLLNGIDIGKQTPCVLDELPVGEYTLTVSHAWFETTSERITIAAGDVQKVDVVMQPTFGELVLQLREGVEYYINEKPTSAEVQRLAPGVYSVEARKVGHGNARAQVVIERGKRQTPELVPNPLYGKLRIQSQPFGARIEVDGVHVGETPFTVRDLLVGKHSVAVSMKGYVTETAEVTVQEEATVDVNIPLVAEVVQIETAADGEAERANEPTPAPTASATAEASEIERIVTNYYRALGGLEKLRAIRTYSDETTMNWPSYDMVSTTSKQMILPDRLRTTTKSNDIEIEQIINGDRGISDVTGTRTEIEGEMLENMKENLRFDHFVDLLENAETLVFAGKRAYKGTVYDCFETYETNMASQELNMNISYYFDTLTHLLVAMESKSEVNGVFTEWTMEYTNYTEVQGMKFASAQNMEMTMADGTVSRIVYTTKNIRINEPINESVLSFGRLLGAPLPSCRR